VKRDYRAYVVVGVALLLAILIPVLRHHRGSGSAIASSSAATTQASTQPGTDKPGGRPTPPAAAASSSASPVAPPAPEPTTTLSLDDLYGPGGAVVAPVDSTVPTTTPPVPDEVVHQRAEAFVATYFNVAAGETEAAWQQALSAYSTPDFVSTLTLEPFDPGVSNEAAVDPSLTEGEDQGGYADVTVTVTVRQLIDGQSSGAQVQHQLVVTLLQVGNDWLVDSMSY